MAVNRRLRPGRATIGQRHAQAGTKAGTARNPLRRMIESKQSGFRRAKLRIT